MNETMDASMMGLMSTGGSLFLPLVLAVLILGFFGQVKYLRGPR